MGQKVHPKGFRIGGTQTWESRWFAGRDSAKFLAEDLRVRRFIKAKLSAAGIARTEIERTAARIKITIHSAKPGVVIGKKGKDIEDLKLELRKLVTKDIVVNIVEARKADIDAQLVAENIAFQLEKRVNFRRAMKEAVNRALRTGAEGIKVAVGGRLGGAEIARTEKYKEGRVPLHTLRADIDYGTAEAHTTYGVIGVKTWVFKGEKFSVGERVPVESMQL
jgi:small subunit ribosomal protein S3